MQPPPLAFPVKCSHLKAILAIQRAETDVTGSDAGPAPTPRRVICERCGTAFACTLDGPCWCGAEAVQLPLPQPGDTSGFSDCLCRACLHALAAGQAKD